MSGPRVGVTFDGSAVGAVTAARQTALAIDKVKVSAAGSSAPLRGMERDLGRVERGAFAGSGAFRGMGRSIAFASGAFLGAAGFVAVIKSSIDVVLAAQTGIAKLDQAIVNAHASVKALTPILESHAAAARLLGFSDDQTREAEAKLVTAFGATKHALGEVQVAADLARATNTDLGSATKQLILLQEGNMRAAKQFGLALPDLTAKVWAQKAAQDGLTVSQEKGKTLYDELLPRIKDQAKALADTPAGKIKIFHAEVQHLQESIGQGLLPVVDKYLTEVDAWLAKSSNQKKVTDDVKKVVGDLAGALHDAKDATGAVLKVVNPVVHAMGGWKTVIEDLIALKFATMLTGWTGGLRGLIGTEAAAGGTGLLGANAASAGLLGKLKMLGALGAIAIAIDLVINAKAVDKKVAAFLDSHGLGFLSGDQNKASAYQQYMALPGQLRKLTPAQVSQLPGSPQSTAPGNTAKQRSIVNTAEQLGPASGGIYVTGGTGGGVVGSTTGGKITLVPGFDCSGYLYEIYKKNGVDIPRTSEAQFNDPRAQDVTGNEQPGDGVYFVGSSEYAPPGHCGIYVGGGQFIEYYQSGKPARVSQLSGYPGYMGARRWVQIKQQGSGLGAGTGTPFGPDLTKTTHTTTTTTTKPKKTPWVGMTQSALTTAQGSIAATLKGLPATLDPEEKNAVAHIEALQSKLRIHMTPAALAADRVELTKWGKVLHTEITANAKVIAAAAAEAKQVFDRALSLDVSHILRDFDQNYAAQIKTFDTETSRSLKDMQTAFSRQQALFDRATQQGLAGFVVAQTPEEKALADFIAGRAATVATAAAARRTTDLATQQAALSTMQQVGVGGTDATGTVVTQAMLDSAVAAVTTAQDAINQASLDTQQAGLQAAADLSRTAADAKTSADQQAYQDSRDLQKQALQDAETDREQAYQDQRDAQKIAMQNVNDDAKTLLQQHLDDLGTSLGQHLITWQTYFAELAKLGVDTSGFSVSLPGGLTVPSGVIGGGFGGGFAKGTGVGGVPGQYVGRDDTVLARVTPGEDVLTRSVSRQLEDFLAGGGTSGGPGVTIVTLNGREIARQTATPMSAEQARQIGYTIQRG